MIRIAAASILVLLAAVTGLGQAEPSSGDAAKSPFAFTFGP